MPISGPDTVNMGRATTVALPSFIFRSLFVYTVDGVTEAVARSEQFNEKSRNSSYVGESLLAEKKHRFVGLDAKNLGLHELNRRTVDLDQTVATLAISDSRSIFLAAKDLDRLNLSLHFKCLCEK